MQGNFRQPEAAELYMVISQVLEEFAYLSALPYFGQAPDMPFCFRAAMPEGQGWLVLRGTRELARELAETSTGSASDGLDEDAFVELCNITASHLAERQWTGTKVSWVSFLPQPGLPEGKACTTQLLDINGQALEISFWAAS